MGLYTWVPASNGEVPSEAVEAGKDIDGSVLYVGRASYEKDLLPAKISSAQKAALVSYNGKEHKVCDYEVLTSFDAAWVACSKGSVPENVIEIGYAEGGEKLYIGRVIHKGTLTPGKIHASHKVLYIPFNGEEIAYEDYEVLTLN